MPVTDLYWSLYTHWHAARPLLPWAADLTYSVLYVVYPNRAHRQPPDTTAGTTAVSLCPLSTGRDVLPAAAGRGTKTFCFLKKKFIRHRPGKPPSVPRSLKCQSQKLTEGKLASINCKNESAGQRACPVQEQVYCPRGDAS